jgi:hypothetical protein
MPTQTSTFNGTLILLIVASLAAAAMLLPRFAHDRYAELQTRNLVFADRYIRAIYPALQNDTRFREVTASTFTGADGSVMITGRVASEAGFSDLKRIIEQSQPRITILVTVSVGDEAQMRTFEIRYPER